MDICSALSRCLGLAGPSSSPGPSFDRSNIIEISDHVFRIGTKPEKPSAEIVCFHGLQLKDQNEPHITTWLSRDETQVWLNWLIEEFPDVHILIVRYDASTKKTTERGRMDMFLTCENILGNLTQRGVNGARVGEAGCPIVLVGHCLGGLILKEVCVQAGDRAVSVEGKDFFNHVQAVLFYASPHQGSKLPVWSTRYPKGALLQDVAPLYADRARRNEAFRKLQNERNWITYGFGELRPVTLNNFSGLVVPEASSRHGVDAYYTVDDDHFNVCRSDSKKSANYSILANLIDKVIKKDEASVPFPNDLPDNIVGLEENVETIRRKLNAESRVAIVGMGGIGKTTLALAVFQRIGIDFQYSCFYKEVKNSMTEKETPQGLRYKISTKLVDHRGRSVGESFQWNELTGKRVLVVLDDVEFQSQIKLMMAEDKFHKESRVIITARDRGFIQRAKLGFDIHEVDKLDADSSRELFCLCAFGQKESPAEFYKQMEDIVKKCDGLPLALTITGKYLYSQRKSLWQDAFKRLREAKSLDGRREGDGLWLLLRPSVDSLDYEEKEMFLDVAALFHGESLDEVKMVWKVCKWASPDIGWRNLLDRHLVKEEGGEIYMHEVLRDLGRKEAGRSRMLVSDLDTVDTFSNEEAAVVKVVKGEMKELDQSRERLLCKLTKMKVLWLDMDLTDTSNQSQWMELNWSALKEVVFAKVLRASSSTLTKILGLQSLESLNISKSKFKAIPAEVSRLHRLQDLDISSCYMLKAIPAEINWLQGLRVLKMSGCYNLVTIPAEIGGLQSLHNLDISSCFKLRAIPAEISGLHSLRVLNMFGCHNLVTIPAEIGGLQSLQNLDISGCSKLEAIPAEIRGLQSLCVLNMYGCHNLVTIPTEIGELQSLDNLDISSCSQLQAIPIEISGLQSLRVLNMSCCRNLVTIPVQIGGLQSLQNLDISSCSKLEVISAEINGLRRLQDWNISGCSKLEMIPEKISGLESLGFLNMSYCKKLIEISMEIGGLQRLQNLDISYCPKLEAIPAEIGGLHSLRVLNMSGCKNLVTIPAGIAGLQSLQNLNISSCSKLEAIPAEISGLQSLCVLNMSSCDNLVMIPAEIGELQTLDNLDISYCSHLEVIPVEISGLQSLRVLNLTCCYNLIEISKEIGGLQRLQNLDISGCSKLQAIPAEISGLHSLRVLNMSGCENLVTIPAEIGGLQSLHNLDISYCSQLEAIPAEISGLQSLCVFNMSHCDNLVMIPTEIGELQSLDNLDISYCSQLEAIPIEINGLQSLRVLNMSCCHNLVTIPIEIGGLQSLQNLDISYCSKLEAIPVEISGLKSLHVLNMSRCHNLVTIPAEIGRLQSLQDLDISYCSQLEAIPVEISGLQSLRFLRTSGCDNLVTISAEISGLQSL